MEEGAEVPASGESETPSDDVFVRAVTDWILALSKAIRGARVYAENNEMHQKFVDRAHESLTLLLSDRQEFTLGVREDRLLLGSDVVHHDSDRKDGLPFILYRNSFRRITFVSGMTRSELLGLVGAVNADYSTFDFTGEDLVSTLWRLQLPHLRYVTIDALSVESKKKDSDTDIDPNDVDRIQADIESIVAAIYRNGVADDDIVAGVSIGLEDLEALKQLRSEPVEDLDVLDHATERAIADIPPGQLQAVQAFLESDDRDALIRRMLDILVFILFKEQSGAAGSTTIELLQQLYDSMLMAQQYGDARGLVDRLRDSVERSEDMQEMHISQHLLRLFATEARVHPVLDAFNDGYRTVPLSDLVSFLRSLGPSVAPVLLSGLANLDSAAHRKLICDLIVEFGVPDVHHLEERSADAKWFVVRDILELARHHPLERITRLVREALVHEHPKVRAQAVRALRDYGPGMADEFIAQRLADEDPEVRVIAARVAAARRSKAMLPSFESLLKAEDLADRDLRELRMLLGAYASIGQGQAVRTLGALLHPTFFGRLKGPDLQIAAASALGLIPSDAARAHLRKGARALSSKVREACRRALAQTRRTIIEPQDDLAPQAAGPDPFEMAELPTETLSLESREVDGNSADMSFTIGGGTGSVAPGPTTSSSAHPVVRTGPALPTVDVPRGSSEMMPANLPPVPTRAETPPPLGVETSSEMAPSQVSAIEAFEAAYEAARAEEPSVPTSQPDLGPEILEYLGIDPATVNSAEPGPDALTEPVALPADAEMAGDASAFGAGRQEFIELEPEAVLSEVPAAGPPESAERFEPLSAPEWPDGPPMAQPAARQITANDSTDLPRAAEDDDTEQFPPLESDYGAQLAPVARALDDEEDDDPLEENEALAADLFLDGEGGGVL